MLKVGTPAPNFVAESTQGTIRLKDYIGKKNVILFFYPKNDTPICNKQLCEAQASLDEYNRMDTQLLGINQDSLENHKKYAEKEGIIIPLVSDLDKRIINVYGVGNIKEYPELAERTVFVIDQEGVIRFAEEGNPSTRTLMQVIEQSY